MLETMKRDGLDPIHFRAYAVGHLCNDLCNSYPAVASVQIHALALGVVSQTFVTAFHIRIHLEGCA